MTNDSDVRILEQGPLVKRQRVAVRQDSPHIEPGQIHVVKFKEVVDEEWTVNLPSGGAFICPYGHPKGTLMECRFLPPESDLAYDTSNALIRIFEEGQVEISVSSWTDCRLFNQTINPHDGSTSMTVRATQPKNHPTGNSYTLPNNGRPLFTVTCDGAGKVRVLGPQEQALPFSVAKGGAGVLIATEPGEETGLGWLVPPPLIYAR